MKAFRFVSLLVVLTMLLGLAPVGSASVAPAATPNLLVTFPGGYVSGAGLPTGNGQVGGGGVLHGNGVTGQVVAADGRGVGHPTDLGDQHAVGDPLSAQFRSGVEVLCSLGLIIVA